MQNAELLYQRIDAAKSRLKHRGRVERAPLKPGFGHHLGAADGLV